MKARIVIERDAAGSLQVSGEVPDLDAALGMLHRAADAMKESARAEATRRRILPGGVLPPGLPLPPLNGG